jgi:glutamine amidotransferase
MSKTICIIDYNAGNIMSLCHMVNNISHYKTIVSNDIEDVKNADYLILPGVGSYSYVSNYLANKNLDKTLKEAMIDYKKPILGICLGMQILFESSNEFGFSKGLGIFKGNVTQFNPNDVLFPLPNIGWRKVCMDTNAKIPFIDGWYYFAHSFHVTDVDSEIVVGTSNYGIQFPAVINYNNFYGVQFHPEKSSASGVQFLKTFFEI